MKIKFDLNNFGINNIDSKKVGDDLSTRTLNTILSHIVHHYMYSKYEKTPIPSYVLRNINKNYKAYIDLLKRCDIIKTGTYVVGKHSRHHYFTDLFKKYAVVVDIKTTTTDTKQELLQNPMIVIDKNVEKKLYQDFNDFIYMDKPIKNELLINTIDLEVYDFKKYITSLLNTKRILEGNTYYNWKTGRLYNNFTSCASTVRANNFKFTNQLTSLDVNNSFPLFLALWCVDKGICISDYEFSNYCSLVKKGEFYRDLRLKLNKIKDTDGKEHIDKRVKNFYSTVESKIIFQKWLNKKTTRDQIDNNVFKMNYECIYELVDETKYKMYDEIVKLETDFIMNVLVKRIYDEVDGIQILTCHDEIYFEEEYKDKVKIIWDEELNKLYSSLPIVEDVVLNFNDYDFVEEFK